VLDWQKANKEAVKDTEKGCTVVERTMLKEQWVVEAERED